MDHAELVAEMPQVEQLSTQDRLNLARMRRAQQLKVAKQKEKEWQKTQNRRDRSSVIINNCNFKRHITFMENVILLEAAARNDVVEVARLLQKGVGADATNMDGLTALHQCCIDDNAEMLKLLIDYGANVNAQDSERWTPLHAAATCGNFELVKILISRGANLLAVNADGNMPYDICDDEDTLDFIEAEMSRHGVTQELIDETRAATETTMLLDLQDIASKCGDLEVPDKTGATPLHIAAANGYVRVVEFLLEQHVSTECCDLDIWTPVHASACWGHIEVLELLANYGADLNVKNKNDETPSDICEDAEIRERIKNLKTEQESKRLAEAQKKRVRRSQSSNTRAQSVRRTSLRDKTLTTKKDAAEETKLRLQAQSYTITDVGTISQNILNAENNNPSSMRPLQMSNLSNVSTNNNINKVKNNNTYNSNNNSCYPVNPKNQNPFYSQSTSYPHTNPNSYHFDPSNRHSPEGKDSDSYTNEIENTVTSANATSGQQKNNNGVDVSAGAEVYSISNNENGKINVQVTVLFDQSVTGTLADLKKHRSQSRSSSSPENCSILTNQPSKSTAPLELSSKSDQQATTKFLTKFSGNTSEIVSDSTRSRRCCAVM